MFKPSNLHQNQSLKWPYFYETLDTKILIDDAFSTGTRLERAGIAGPVRCLWMLGSSAKIRNKKDWWGSLVASLMPKSVLSSGRED